MFLCVEKGSSAASLNGAVTLLLSKQALPYDVFHARA